MKVLDFGIAKSTALDANMGGETARATSLTMDGTLMGTPPYMSPEQVRGGQVDEKTDVWAAGCVLFEMLTGARAFAAETASDTLAHILTKEPDWGVLPTDTPDRVRDLLARALRKDPDRRLQHIADVRSELDGAQAAFLESPSGSARKVLVALLGVAALALAAGWYFLGDGGDPELPGEREAVAPGEIRSIVVLPLTNLMNDPGQGYFVEGMHEALITELSKIKALRVISKTSAMHYEDSGKPVPEIARELGVDAVVAGSVLRAGNVVRVTARLIEARSDSHIWADNFDRELDDILALYADVTREIVDQIRVTLTPDEQASLAISRPIDPEVYDLYLKGATISAATGVRRRCSKASSYCNGPLNLDPQHAASQAQLALCLVDTVFFDYMTPMEIDSRTREAALTAVQLDDRLAEGHVALGQRELLPGIRSKIRRSANISGRLEMNPNSIDALLHLSWVLAAAGRTDEAFGPTQRALELDPLSTAVTNAMGQIYYLNRDFDRAIQEYETALELDRSDPSLHFYLAGPFEQQGQYERAIALYESAIELSGGAPLYVAALGHAYGAAGMREEALQILQQLQQTASASPYALAVVLSWSGSAMNRQWTGWREPLKRATANSSTSTGTQGSIHCASTSGSPSCWNASNGKGSRAARVQDRDSAPGCRSRPAAST